MASNFYRSQDSPRFILGHALELGFIGLGVAATLTPMFFYKRNNNFREKKMAEGAERNYTVQELSAQGDRAVTFRYMF
jgi:hypothetical protein